MAGTHNNRYLFQLLLLTISLDISRAGYSKILTGEHFDHVLSVPGTREVARNAVLVLHTPSCQPEVDWIEYDHHQLYLVHDYLTSRNYVWYDYRDDVDDLAKRYRTSDAPCMIALYFEKGGNIDQPTLRMKDGLKPQEWFWDLLKTKVEVKNEIQDMIILQHYNDKRRPHIRNTYVNAGDSVNVDTYIGYTLYVRKSVGETVLEAAQITSSLKRIVVDGQEVEGFESVVDLDDTYRARNSTWLWSHGERHLRNLKQPLLVHNYTATGYVKVPMPLDLFISLNRFYQAHRNQNFDESIDEMNSIHDKTGDRKPKMVQLSDQMMNDIEQVLKPQLEEWSKTKLKRTAIYGVREYYKGNVLQNHVDRIETHVISVILQIDQDKGSGGDWMLEVIDYNGKRQQIKLLPGEMLLYESAKLIHGRPKPFQGNRFANAFVHFAPVEEWDYTFVGSHFHSPRGLREPLDPLMTSLTANRNMFSIKDEL